ncbi:MAG: prephenate dehydrogenase [Oscillospiraceae bacterium]|nr:prephenate dehydrogenase [Oscillospiraceae bacterium]
MKKLTIVGLGLIGGSIAKALRPGAEWTISAIDADHATVCAALSDGTADFAGSSGLTSLLDGAELVVLALSPSLCVRWLEENGALIAPGTVVTDVCGVKRHMLDSLSQICAKYSLRYVPGHPMAGRERSGYISSVPELFRGCSYILTPDGSTDPEALELVRSFALSLGAGSVNVTDALTHDKMIAFTSQLPPVLAGSYVKSPVSAFHKGYSAGSYRDVSRVAPVDENLWKELFLLNGDCLIGEIDMLITHLTEYKIAILTGETEKIADVVRQGRLVKQKIDAPEE